MNTARLCTLASAFALAVSARSEEATQHAFIRFDGGVIHQHALTIKDSGGAKLSYERGLRFDLGLGGYRNKWWGAEVECGVIYNSVKSIGGVPLSSTGDRLEHYQVPMLVNVLGSLPMGDRFQLDLGAGIGGICSWFWRDGILNSSQDLTFGFQGKVGARYAITRKCDLGLSYKFLGSTDHDFGFGLKTSGTRSHSLLAEIGVRF